MTTPSTLQLLLSATAFRTWGERIAAAVPDGISFVTADEAIAGAGP